MLDQTSHNFLGLSQRTPPSNLMAEQALLGAILANNKAYENVASFLKPEHFADPANGMIYLAIQRHRDREKLVDGLILQAYFEKNNALDDVGGTAYLARLMASMVGIINAAEYGQVIHDAWVRRQLIDIGEKAVNAAFSDPDTSGYEQIEKTEQSLFSLATNGAAVDTGPVSIASAVKAAVEEGEMLRSGKGALATSTGIPSLDDKILGLRPGHLIILGARPGMGKSTLSRCVAVNVGTGRGVKETGEVVDDPSLALPVCYFSNEETATDLGAACLAQIAGLSIGPILGSVEPSNDEYLRLVKAQKRFSDSPIFIYDRPRQGLRTIAMESRRAARKHGRLGLIVVDYLQLMPDAPGTKDKRLAVGQNAYGLKDLAKELGVPVLALSQLSRSVESRPDKRPTMSDLRESGEIEDSADAIMLLYREAYYLGQERPVRDSGETESAYQIRLSDWQSRLSRVENDAQAIIPKVRRGRAPTVADLYFNGACLDLPRFRRQVRAWDQGD